MIISRTPYRVSFFGGGTDYPTWFREHGGCVLTSSINRYCYISCRFLPAFFEHKYRIVWSQIELPNTVDEIHHPAIRETIRYMQIKDGLEIHHIGDLPARTGLGSSSAFTVGLLHALSALLGQAASKRVLAEQAIMVEQQLLLENVGVQDQIETAFGGFNKVDIAPDGSFSVNPVVLQRSRLEALQQNLLLFYTGVARHASTVAASKIDAIPKKVRELHNMRALVDEACEVVTSGHIDDFGHLLHETWLLKRSLSTQVAPAFVNEIYERAIAAGALGGKLLGAGGGGFMLFYVQPEYRAAVLDALSSLLVVPFEFENRGTHLAMYEPEFYSATSHRRRDFERNGFTPASHHVRQLASTCGND